MKPTPSRNRTPEERAAWELARLRRPLKITLSAEGRAALQEIADEWGTTLSGAVEGLAVEELAEQERARKKARPQR